MSSAAIALVKSSLRWLVASISARDRKSREVDEPDFVRPDGEGMELLEQYMGRSWAHFDVHILTKLRALAVYATTHNVMVCWS